MTGHTFISNVIRVRNWCEEQKQPYPLFSESEIGSFEDGHLPKYENGFVPIGWKPFAAFKGLDTESKQAIAELFQSAGDIALGLTQDQNGEVHAFVKN